MIQGIGLCSRAVSRSADSTGLLSVQSFKYIDQLSNYLSKNFIIHEPGKFLIIPKPYGISCVGDKQPNGGVFTSGKHNEKDEDESLLKKRSDRDVTITDCLPNLQHIFREPKLQFCVGLKRNISGAIVLPANDKESVKLKNSVKYSSLSNSQNEFHYRSLAILLGNPPSNESSISGYATFVPVGSYKEYIFVEGKATKRAKAGHYAVAGTMNYRVLSRKHGCSLVEFGINKFSRHLPRLMFSHMLCPILGDRIYSNRLINVDGKPALLNPSKRNRKTNLWFPTSIGTQLGIQTGELQRSMPLYCHVYSTLFPRYGWSHGMPKEQQDITDLIAAIPPPDHFMAMIKALNMEGDLLRFFRENDDPISSDVGGDLAF